MKKYLIVVDIQNDFVDGALGTPEAVAIIDGAAKKISEFEGKIFVTFDTHDENYMNTAEGKKLPVPHCIRASNGWQLNEKIAAALEGKDYTAVEKPTFGSTKLAEIIKADCGDSTPHIELIGLCTDICVVSNALLLKANFPEGEISVDAALCAGVTPKTHAAALDTMRCCQIEVLGEY